VFMRVNASCAHRLLGLNLLTLNTSEL